MEMKMKMKETGYLQRMYEMRMDHRDRYILDTERMVEIQNE